MRDLVSKLCLGAVTEKDTLRDLYLKLLRRCQPTICCDIGANDGQAALLAQRAVPAARIFAFEANPEIYAFHNRRLTDTGIRYHNLAIAEADGEATVHAPRTLSKAWVRDGEIIDAAIEEPIDTGKTSLLRRNEEATYREFKIATRSLDSLFAGESSDTSLALWIDVEGAALGVLRGAEATLRVTRVLFVEVEGYPFWKNQATASEVALLLRDRGFVPVARDREYGDDQFNVLFVRAEDAAWAAEIVASVSHSYPSSDLPVIVPSFNNPTYLRQMITQLGRVGLAKITVVDNASTYPPHLEYLKSLEPQVTVLHRDRNDGPRTLFRDAIFLASLPQYFCITDPDLAFNPALPAEFLEHLTELTRRHSVGKAGFALDISEPERLMDEPFQIGTERHRIWDWEAQFWQTPLAQNTQDIPYRASIDTTFALYNRDFFRAEHYLDAIRVAGRYTARHLPWYRDQFLPAEEDAFYRQTSRFSFYTGTPPPT